MALERVGYWATGLMEIWVLVLASYELTIYTLQVSGAHSLI